MPLVSHTGNDVVTYVKRQFGDESGVQITDSDITRWINQSQMEIVSKNMVLRATATVAGGSVAGQDTYSKPIGSPSSNPPILECLRVTAIKYGTTLLQYIGFDQYQLLYQGTVTPQTIPTNYTVYGDNIILAPAPSVAGDTITIYYIPEPTIIGSASGQNSLSDPLSIPDRYFDRVCEYCMSKAYELDEDWDAHQTQRTLFETNLTNLSNEETNTQGPYPVVVDYLYGETYAW